MKSLKKFLNFQLVHTTSKNRYISSVNCSFLDYVNTDKQPLKKLVRDLYDTRSIFFKKIIKKIKKYTTKRHKNCINLYITQTSRRRAGKIKIQ